MHLEILSTALAPPGGNKEANLSFLVPLVFSEHGSPP